MAGRSESMIEIGIIIAATTTVTVLVIETAIQAYRRYKDNTSSEISELEQEIEELKAENSKLEEQVERMTQYLFGYSKGEDDGVLEGIQESLESIQCEMKNEHQQMCDEIKTNNRVIGEVIDELHALNTTENFDRDNISEDKCRFNDD